MIISKVVPIGKKAPLSHIGTRWKPPQLCDRSSGQSVDRGPRYRQEVTTPTASARSTGGVFYGWVIVAVVFLSLMVTSGLGFYNAAVILVAAREELGASVSAVSFGPTLFFTVGGLTGFALSSYMDRVDLRAFYLAGGILGAAALVALRWVSSVAELYVFYAAFGASFALAGLVPGVTLVARWFSRRRSIALSIASSGLSAGGILFTPVASNLIDDRTLSGAGPLLAIGWFVGVVPLSLLLLRSQPADKGLEPDGDPTPAEPVVLTGTDFAAAKTSRYFRVLAVVYALVFLAQVGALAHLASLVTERVDRSAGALALSVLAFASVVGRLVGGVIATRVQVRGLTAVLIVVQASALLFLALAETQALLLVSSALLGLSVGNLLMLQPLLLVEAFGVKHNSQIYSLSQLVTTVGVAIGPLLYGGLRDAIDYRASFLVAGVLNLLAMAILTQAGPTPTPAD